MKSTLSEIADLLLKRFGGSVVIKDLSNSHMRVSFKKSVFDIYRHVKKQRITVKRMWGSRQNSVIENESHLWKVLSDLPDQGERLLRKHDQREQVEMEEIQSRDYSVARYIFIQSDAAATTNFYNELLVRGKLGQIAAGLFRAQKRSTRAKIYRGRGMRQGAYDAKREAMDYLCKILSLCGDDLGFVWGWGHDRMTTGFEHVLYIEIPSIGQVSFHSNVRLQGPEYSSPWDGQRRSQDRIIELCDCVMASPRLCQSLSPEDAMPFGKHVGTKIADLSPGYVWYLTEKWDGLDSWWAVKPCLQPNKSTSPVQKALPFSEPEYIAPTNSDEPPFEPGQFWHGADSSICVRLDDERESSLDSEFREIARQQ